MRTPDKQRFLDAVNHIESEEIPFFELEVDAEIVAQLLGKDVDVSKHSFELPIDDVVEFNRRIGNDMIYFSHVWRLGRKEMIDDKGKRHYIDGTMKTPASLENISFPDLDQIRSRLDELFEKIDGSGFGVFCGAQTAGFTVSTAIGYEDFCMKTILDPEFIDEFQKRIHEYAMRELEVYLSYPVEGFKIASGLVTNTGPMISPDMMERFEFRFMREQIELIKSHDRLVLLHVDGFVEPMIPMFIEMGADILNPIEPAGGRQDIYRIKQDFGEKIALCGNIDIDGVLLNGTPDDVTWDVNEHIARLSANGGYVPASSHNLHHMIPIENVFAMINAVHSHETSQNEFHNA